MGMKSRIARLETTVNRLTKNGTEVVYSNEFLREIYEEIVAAGVPLVKDPTGTPPQTRVSRQDKSTADVPDEER
jgi:hypothetical protein